ncbi:RNA-binding S4 domain-containing protein [Denitratisoma sp. agr-D3]
MRLDKWLWAARFFKTRSMAADAVDGGKVKLGGVHVKPAKEVRVGDRLHIRAGEQDYEVMVLALNEQRRPAPEARLMYEESEESVERRRQAAELRALAPAPGADSKGRPTKRDRRLLSRLRG